MILAWAFGRCSSARVSNVGALWRPGAITKGCVAWMPRGRGPGAPGGGGIQHSPSFPVMALFTPRGLPTKCYVFASRVFLWGVCLCSSSFVGVWDKAE
jgi:hypothetical protein